MSMYEEYNNVEYPNSFDYEEEIESLMKYNYMDYDEAYIIAEEFERQFGDDLDFKED